VAAPPRRGGSGADAELVRAAEAHGRKPEAPIPGWLEGDSLLAGVLYREAKAMRSPKRNRLRSRHSCVVRWVPACSRLISTAGSPPRRGRADARGIGAPDAFRPDEFLTAAPCASSAMAPDVNKFSAYYSERSSRPRFARSVVCSQLLQTNVLDRPLFSIHDLQLHQPPARQASTERPEGRRSAAGPASRLALRTEDRAR